MQQKKKKKKKTTKKPQQSKNPTKNDVMKCSLLCAARGFNQLIAKEMSVP